MTFEPLPEIARSLVHLWSFNHAECDAILQGRNIYIPNAYDPGKVPIGRDSVYSGTFAWLIIETALIVASLVWYRRKDTPNRLLYLSFFGIGGVIWLVAGFAQAYGVSQYVVLCRAVLGR